MPLTLYTPKISAWTRQTYIFPSPTTENRPLRSPRAMASSGAIDIVIIDSVAALVPRAEIQGEMGESHMGLQARLMSQALRKITAFAGKSNCTVVFINQLREKIGVTFGNPETTTGGRALKFYASVRLDIRRADAIKVNNEIVGNRTKVKIAKNKVAPPFKTTEFDIMYGQGISREGDTLDMAAELGIVNKSGAWYAYKEEKIGQGRENAKAYLKEHPEVLEEIEAQVREHYGLNKKNDETAETEPAAEEKPKKTRKTKAAPKEEESIEFTEEDMADMDGFGDDIFDETELPDDDDVLIIPSDAYRRADD